MSVDTQDQLVLEAPSALRHGRPNAAPPLLGHCSAAEWRRARSGGFNVLDARAACARSSSLRVALAGKLTALEAPGGGETQLASLTEALCLEGVDARLWRPWHDKWADYDALHFVGSSPEMLDVARAARRQGRRVVISPVAWYGLASAWGEPGAWRLKLAKCGKLAARRAWRRFSAWRDQLYATADLLLPNSRAEAEQLVRLFKAPPSKVRVVPNGASRRFAHGDPQLFVKRFGIRDFVLYAGRIEPRKNQLTFLRAMHGTGVPIVILGDVVPGFEAYAQACREAADANVRFIGRVRHGDPLLASAYAACSCLALVSWFETPGLVALEAAMSGTPLVLSTYGTGREYFGELADYVSPRKVREIRRGVLAALARGRNPALAELVAGHYDWAATAAMTRDAYATLL